MRENVEIPSSPRTNPGLSKRIGANSQRRFFFRSGLASLSKRMDANSQLAELTLFKRENLETRKRPVPRSAADNRSRPESGTLPYRITKQWKAWQHEEHHGNPWLLVLALRAPCSLLNLAGRLARHADRSKPVSQRGRGQLSARPSGKKEASRSPIHCRQPQQTGEQDAPVSNKENN